VAGDHRRRAVPAAPTGAAVEGLGDRGRALVAAAIDELDLVVEVRARSTSDPGAKRRSTWRLAAPLVPTSKSGDCSVTVDWNSETRLRPMVVSASNEPAGWPSSPS
jgi:hypothetical protein